MDDPDKILIEVRGCLDAWDIRPRDISLASLSENVVYRVIDESGNNWALRIHRPGYHTLAELESEHEWTAALGAAGFILPDALATTGGDYYVPVTVSGGIRYAGVVRWLPGKVLYDREKEDGTDRVMGVLRQLGETMAKLHNHSENWQPSEGFTRHRLDVDGFFGETPFWGRYWDSPYLSPEAKSLLLASQAPVIRRLEALGEGPRVFGMIHADLHHGNVHMNGETLAIIDFDDAGFGWYLYDIAVGLFEYLSRDNFEDYRDSLLSGYAEHRPVPADVETLLPVFLFIRASAIIGWATARPELDNAERITKLVKHTCDDALALFPELARA